MKPGDTLFLISKRTNYRQSSIIAANPGLNANRLRVGQKLKLPGAAAAEPAQNVAKADAKPAVPEAKDAKVLPAAAPSPAAANTKAPVKTKSSFVAYEGPTKEYVVKSGDSLGKIAMECGLSIRALKALNGLQKDNLRLGQKLKIPVEKQTVAKPAAAKSAVPAKPAVPAKDAAAKPTAPAKEAAAKTAAPVKDAAVKPDAAAKPVAAPAPVAVEATKPAETVAAPAPTETAKPVEVAKPEEPAPAVEAPAPAPAPANTYTVKEGDDLVSIAIAYGISPSALMDINDLKPTDEIKPGQVLKLPANAKASVQ